MSNVDKVIIPRKQEPGLSMPGKTEHFIHAYNNVTSIVKVRPFQYIRKTGPNF